MVVIETLSKDNFIEDFKKQFTDFQFTIKTDTISGWRIVCIGFWCLLFDKKRTQEIYKEYKQLVSYDDYYINEYVQCQFIVNKINDRYKEYNNNYD